MNKKVLLLVSALATVGVSALAIWLSGFSLTGSFTATSGEKGMQLETWDISITSDFNTTNLFTYYNADGTREVSFTLTDNIVSANSSCNYEPDKDVVFSVNGCHLTASTPCNQTMYSGNNDINVTVTPHHNRCSLQGSYAVGFVI